MVRLTWLPPKNKVGVGKIRPFILIGDDATCIPASCRKGDDWYASTYATFLSGCELKIAVKFCVPEPSDSRGPAQLFEVVLLVVVWQI